MNWGCGISDYEIKIGAESGEICTMEILRDDVITCRPPSRKPHSSNNPVEVSVSV